MIIATAGHVDHGKTSLVRALTGANTDRLPEEKKRGLTIDIGFAYLKIEAGQSLAFIDVPGHEKFVRNMIAGVGLLDIAIVVVAADDGPMPQTYEHIAILQLMAVRNVVAVISKTDLVESDRVAQVADGVADLLNTAGFKNTKQFCLATTDMAAVAALKEHVTQLAQSQRPRRGRGYFRMAIDRSFILDGSGTVVTGTVVAGEVAKGETVTLASAGVDHEKAARVRSLHAQNTESDKAYTGQRCALNLSGELTRSMLRRGDWLVTNPNVQRVKVVDVMLTRAVFADEFQINNDKQSNKKPSTPLGLRHWTPAHLHLGTADIPCRIVLLETRELAFGEYGLARLICDKAFTAVHGDRFVLRDQSARKTIAGGRVLDPYPPKRGRSKPERLQKLHALNADSPEEVLSGLLGVTQTGVNLDRFALRLDLTPDELLGLVNRLSLATYDTSIGVYGMTKDQSTQLKSTVIDALQQFHHAHPGALGANVMQLQRAYLQSVKSDVLEHYLKILVVSSQVVRSATVYRLSDHQVVLSDDDQNKWKKVAESLSSASLSSLRVVELAEILDETAEQTVRFLNVCVSHGKLYKVTENRYFLPQSLRDLASIAASLSASERLTVAEFRDQSGIGRNLVVELLEYFDRCRFTQRLGDRRQTLSAVEDKF